MKNRGIKKAAIVLVFGLFLLSFVSADMSFVVQPNPIYNIGDNVNTTIRINSGGTFNSLVSANLNCPGGSFEVYKEFLSFSGSIQKTIIVPLVLPLIGNLSGTCQIEIDSGGNPEVVSNNFVISKSVRVSLSNTNLTFSPGDGITFSATAVKDDGKNANGFYSAIVDNSTFTGTVSNGNFDFDYILSKDMVSGQHEVSINVYEKNSDGDVTNSGSKIYFFVVNQIPNNVEVYLDEKNVNPGSEITGKIILHDQTGKSISGKDAYVAVKDSSGKILEKIVTKTDENFSYSVPEGEAPQTFEISAYSENIINSAQFEIPEYKKINSEIGNSTLILTNVGNVFYNDTLIIQIGDENVSVPVSLGVGESQKYSITAPDGNYQVSVGDVQKTLTLSGNAVDVQKIGDSFNFSAFAWIFLIIVLALGVYFLFKKTRKKKSVAKFSKLTNVKKIKPEVLEEKTNYSSEVIPFPTGKKVELSLSIAGTKQDAVLGCISIKNYPEVSSGEGNVRETLSSIDKIIEGNKGLVYANGSYIFFIIAPSFTRTFKNQHEAVLIAEKIKEILSTHNKKFKKKIDFGLSLNYGSIITKVEKDSVKFMSLGTTMTSAKKLSNYSNGDVMISETFNQKLSEKVNASPVDVSGIKAYNLKGFVDKNRHSTFISGFLARQERDRAKAAEKNSGSEEKTGN